MAKRPVERAANFTLALNNFNANTIEMLDVVVRKVALDALKGVVLRTPVDTGRARGGWQVGVNDDPAADLKRLDSAGGGTISEEGGKLSQATAMDTIYISNNVEYIVPLENGWSQQAPYGMVRVTLASMPGVVESAVKEADA